MLTERNAALFYVGTDSDDRTALRCRRCTWFSHRVYQPDNHGFEHIVAELINHIRQHHTRI